jgi:predicted esterase
MKKAVNLQIQADYHTLNELTESTKNIWIVCHGYGQLAEYFIRNFACLNSETNYVIAPQGLSKFYLKSFSGRVGATWMTKESREQEIIHQQRMLTNIFEQETNGLDLGKYKTIFFGFSQGVATITRWALQTEVNFDRLILWSGGFPHDADFEEARKKLENKEFDFLMGKQDKLYNEKQIAEHLKMLESNKLQPKLVFFEGEHQIYDDVLLNLIKK